MHFCEELTGRFRDDRAPMPAIACADPGHITCVANDYGYDQVFSRWVTGLGNKGDALIALSTSGNSQNIINAVEAAKSKGLTDGPAARQRRRQAARAQGDHQWIVTRARLQTESKRSTC